MFRCISGLHEDTLWTSILYEFVKKIIYIIGDECLKQTLSMSNCCGFCRQTITYSRCKPDTTVNEFISKQKVHCENKDQCKWTGDYSDYEQHLLSCKAFVVDQSTHEKNNRPEIHEPLPENVQEYFEDAKQLVIDKISNVFDEVKNGMISKWSVCVDSFARGVEKFAEVKQSGLEKYNRAKQAATSKYQEVKQIVDGAKQRASSYGRSLCETWNDVKCVFKL